MKTLTKIIGGLVLLLSMATTAMATPVDTYEFKSPENQKRGLSLAHELRCPQCQNQNLIDSNSPVARDLRLEVYKMVDEGKGDDEIIEFMTSRYGEFVLYKPKMETKTYILWLGPVGLLLLGLIIGFIFIRKQRIGGTTEPEISAEDQKALDALLKRDNK
ncbi:MULTISPECIES: heme lyase NrfEFG subunit NrfF [Shewanella]|uniref:Formate-dependent nitrite reductase complex subunit n=2 Tax=Shewanella TaxID=22 RepID=A0A220UHE7_9GAMM|nr:MULTISPECIES: heme lyase NrfEFG subunit NrfF [Shewanella]VEE62315.1 Cytochrome c-type biogenesis protein CcmH precursor [Shewanella putrefaciens]ABI37317.1 cytochrome C biogenesis protein [Shewanella sp. MR-4]ASK67587.1 heme lyase NrfEFG subunit NrfF [Shewanella bicestrii]MCL1122847.1 heme lyase NrfEFG subunit NrfF [Shewanella seohaensis]PWF61507.1 heme lyase NrfEFG subunit NrfF [Shewanella sp. BC20]